MNKIEGLYSVLGRETPETGDAMATEVPTENDLCAHLKRMKAQEVGDGIRLKWELGETIRDHYKAERGYGYDQLGVIARKSGWSKSTLQKTCQFAEKYAKEQVETLLQNRFSLAWRDIAQNLCIEPQAFIDAYSRAQTAKEFRNSVIQLRQPRADDTPPPKPKTRKELERELAERDQKIADLENQIQALEVKVESLTSIDELKEPREVEKETSPVPIAERPEMLKAAEEKLLAA
jgi:hypothetical protein